MHCTLSPLRCLPQRVSRGEILLVELVCRHFRLEMNSFKFSRKIPACCPRFQQDSRFAFAASDCISRKKSVSSMSLQSVSLKQRFWKWARVYECVLCLNVMISLSKVYAADASDQCDMDCGSPLFVFWGMLYLSP
jgi:hypothetical protein